MRAPRRPRTSPFTSSRCRSAPRRPRFVAKPSAIIFTTASKSFARQVAIRPRAAHEREQLVLRVIAARGLGDDLLREHVERRVVHDDAIELAALHGAQQRRAFDQIVARDREDAALSAVPETVWPERPTRCRNVAMRCGEPIWQTRSTWPMSMPSSSDAVATSAFSCPLFSRVSASRRFSFERLP